MLRSSLLVVLVLITGCTGGNFLSQTQPLQTHSLGLQQLVLDCNCPISASMQNTATEGELWITDIPLTLLESGEFESGQILRLQVLWLPIPGKTPLASSSTNIAIKQIIFSGDDVGVYIGAGFGWPTISPEEGLAITMEEATIALQSSTVHFDDLLTPATMVGHVYAPENTTLARQLSAYADAYTRKLLH